MEKEGSKSWFLNVLGCGDENFIVLFHSPKIDSAIAKYMHLFRETLVTSLITSCQ